MSEKKPLASVDFDDIVSTLFQATRLNTGNQWRLYFLPGVGVEVERLGGKTRVVPFTKIKCFEFPLG